MDGERENKASITVESEMETTASASDSNDLMDKVTERIEFFFSDAHIFHSRFMQEKIIEYGGCIPFYILLTFSSLNELTKDLKVIEKAARNLGFLQVTDEGIRKPRVNLFQFRDFKQRSIRVSKFKGSIPTPQFLRDIFSAFGKVEYVTILPLEAFVQFSCLEEAVRAFSSYEGKFLVSLNRDTDKFLASFNHDIDAQGKEYLKEKDASETEKPEASNKRHKGKKPVRNNENKHHKSEAFKSNIVRVYTTGKVTRAILCKQIMNKFPKLNFILNYEAFKVILDTHDDAVMLQKEIFEEPEFRVTFQLLGEHKTKLYLKQEKERKEGSKEGEEKEIKKRNIPSSTIFKLKQLKIADCHDVQPEITPH